MNFNKQQKIYIAGHNGMVGSAVLRLLQENGFTYLIYAGSKELNLKANFHTNIYQFSKVL